MRFLFKNYLRIPFWRKNIERMRRSCLALFWRRIPIGIKAMMPMNAAAKATAKTIAATLISYSAQTV